EIVRLRRNVPGAQAHHVVTSLRLAFRHQGQEVLVAVRGDQVDVEVDLFFCCPFGANLFQFLGRAGNPMVPYAKGELAGGVGAVHEGSRERCRRRGLQYRAPSQQNAIHPFLSDWVFVFGPPRPRRLAQTPAAFSTALANSPMFARSPRAPIARSRSRRRSSGLPACIVRSFCTSCPVNTSGHRSWAAPDSR